MRKARKDQSGGTISDQAKAFAECLASKGDFMKDAAIEAFIDCFPLKAGND